MRALPSDSTRKFALPKLRIARMRPAVRVVDLRGVERLAGLRAVRPDDRVDRRLRVEAVRIRTDAELAQLLEIGAPLDDLIGFVDGRHSRSKRRRMASRMPLMNRTESSLLNVRASSSASLMMTRAGVSASCRNS